MKRIKFLTLAILGFLAIPLCLRSQGSPFISFDAQPGVACLVLIQWTTSSDEDTLNFDVERSLDMRTWKKIDQIVYNRSHKYYSLDCDPVNGLNYYRVRKVGASGSIPYTDVKWVQFNKSVNLFIWPNPVRDLLQIKTPFADGMIDVIDMNGKLVLQSVIDNFISQVPTTPLAKGVYILRIKHNKEVFTEKFLRE